MMRAQKAITFLEIILVLSIVMLLSVGVASLVRGMYGQGMQISGEELTHVFRSAQFRAASAQSNSNWGIYMDTAADRYTLYSGLNYAGRTSSLDIDYELPAGVEFNSVSLNGGGTDLNFAKVTGSTTQYGSVEIQSNSGESFTLTINAQGAVLPGL